MSQSDEVTTEEARLNEVHRKIKSGFYLSKRIYEVIAEKVMKELLGKK